MPTIDTGLQNIVNEVRFMGSASLTDVFEGVTYWTDEQLEALAVDSSKFVRVVARLGRPDGSSFLIRTPYTKRFSTTGLRLYKEDSTTPLTEPYTYLPKNGLIEFATPLENVKYLEIEGTLVDLYLTLEKYWGIKAQQRASYVNFKSGSTAVTLSQEFEHCERMRKYYANKRLEAWSR